MSTHRSCVVVGTTLVPSSDEAVSTGARIAQALGAAIHLVHAYDMPMLMGGEPLMPVGYGITSEEVEAGCRQLLAGQMARVRLGGGAEVVTHVAPGPPHRGCRAGSSEISGSQPARVVAGSQLSTP